MWPSHYRHFVERHQLTGRHAEVSEQADRSGLGASIDLLDEDGAASEANDAYPGLIVKADGYVPIGGCSVGSGDPYFIRVQDAPPGPVYRVYHDSVHDAVYDADEAIVHVLDSYEQLLDHLER